MGFFKKIFKGVKKVFKKIGKGIKSAFKSIGKFMNKIGIIGQIGLALILPGIGQMLSGLLVGTTGAGGLAGALQGMGAVGQAASTFIKGAVQIASNTSKFFGTITDGVKNVIGETIGAVANKVPGLGDTLKTITGGKVDITQKTFSSAWDVTQKSMTNIVESGSNILNLNPLSEVTVTAQKVDIPEDSLMNEAPLRDAIDSESALDALTQDRLETEAAYTRVVGQPMPQVPDMSGDLAKTLQSNISQQAGAGTTADPFFTSGATTQQQQQSLLDKASKTLTGESLDANLKVGRQKLSDAATDFLPETGTALGREAIGQAVGVRAKPGDLKPVSYSSAVALGDFETSIGSDMSSPYQNLISQVGTQYASARPYGLMAQQYNFNQYVEEARARGIT